MAQFDYALNGAKIPVWQWHRMNGKDFGALFIRGESEEEKRAGFFLSPRMAYKLFSSASYLADEMEDDPYMEFDHPRACKPYFRQRYWVDSYIECYKRIAARLAKVEVQWTPKSQNLHLTLACT
jgi:hypothetical protein